MTTTSPIAIATTTAARCPHCRKETEMPVERCPFGSLCAVCPNCRAHRRLTAIRFTPPPSGDLFPTDPRKDNS